MIYLKELNTQNVNKIYLKWMNDKKVQKFTEQRYKKHSIKDITSFVKEKKDLRMKFYMEFLQKKRNCILVI